LLFVTVLFSRLAGAEIPSAGTTWQFTQVLSAEVLNVVQDSLDPSTIYAGSRDQGIFKSTDKGMTWQPKNEGITYPWWMRLAMDANNTEVLYASSQNGLFRTLDGAESWTQVDFGYPEASFVVTDPRDSDVVYVAPPALYGLLKSDDAGHTWRRADEGLGAIPPTCLAIDSSQPDKLYAGTWRAVIYKSTDGATRWFELGLRGVITYQLTAAPPDSSRILAATDLGTYQSEDAGMSWSVITPPQPETTLFTSVAIDPDDAGHVLAGTNAQGLWETFDGGQNWNVLDIAGTYPWINAIYFAAPGRLYIGTYSGLFRSL
jgi:photosystem II stability/assembly factor-like uncharacterized protein